MPTKKKYTYKQKTSKKKQYNKKKRTIKKRHTRKKTRYGGSFFKWLKKKQILKKWEYTADINLFTPVLKKDIDFMLEATRINQAAWEHADETLKKDRRFTLKAIQKNASVLKYINNKFKEDQEVVISAVKKQGTDLQYAADNMKKDPDVVTAAVKNNGYAIKFASVDLIKNYEFIVKLLKLYWDGEIKYPGRVDFSLDDNKHPKYKKNRDDNFDLFFIEIDNILEDEKKIKLITRAKEEINKKAGRNVFNHTFNNNIVVNPLHLNQKNNIIKH